MESKKKDKIMHGIIFILVLILGFSIMISINRSNDRREKRIFEILSRIEQMEKWQNEIEKNGINIH